MSYTSRSCVIFTMLVALTGCSDYELNPKIDMIPDIHVSPGSIDFGSLHSGFETNISEKMKHSTCRKTFSSTNLHYME